ncbi:SIS domain-containing protein [Bacillus sp. JJ1764]|uniref:SIS domain-containing protein n=1 Tax=Bacillus sp. JJ1764 TaxID=3122964 RepID=UPI0030006DFE
MKETMMSNILEEEEICHDIFENIESNLSKLRSFIEKEKPKNWLILATGSSANAMLSAKYYMEKVADISIEIQEPFNFVHYEKIKETTDFVLAVSQSGHSFSTIEALKKVQSNGSVPTAVLTSKLESPITHYTDMVIDIGCGIEKVGFVTKGFTATVLTSMLIGVMTGEVLGNLTKDDVTKEWKKLKEITAQIPTVIEKTKSYYSLHAEELNRLPRFAAIGYGPTVGTAKEFETKFTETVRVPSQGFELEAYMHGPYLEVNKSHGLFFILTNSKLINRAEKLKQYFRTYTEHCFTISQLSNPLDEKTLTLGIEMDELMSPLIMAIPIQILSYRIALGRGIDLDVDIFKDFDQVLKSKV